MTKREIAIAKLRQAEALMMEAESELAGDVMAGAIEDQRSVVHDIVMELADDAVFGGSEVF